MSSLEPRRLLAAAFPSAYEQYLVELINRGRADPSAEAARDGIALNEGLTAGTISTAAKQPLAINPFLTDSAHTHSQWMINTDTFSHTGSGGTSPQQRMSNAGYSGFTISGENIAYRSSSGSLDTTTTTALLEQDLFVDAGYAGRGHRTNLMEPTFREVGAGIVTGSFSGLNAVMATQDFAANANVFLTGVAYSDAGAKDNFYSVGEGLSGITITAKRTSDNATSSTTTWGSGGYSLPLAAGTYTVTATGGALAGTITYTNVVIGTQNVKRDFTPTQLDPFATITAGKLTITGTLGVDSIDLQQTNNTFTITRNGAVMTLPANNVTNIEIYAYDGDDAITIGHGIIGCYVDAGAGNDFVQGGDGNDTITGGANKDRLYGGLGDDRLNGNGGHDKLYGEAGKDRLYGGNENDTLDGGSSPDRMWGGPGNNVYYGQGGDDRIYAQNSFADTIFGGAGTDHAQIDNGLDSVTSVEDILP